MGPDIRTKERTLEEAARWQARLASPACTGQDRDDFERWLRRDASHAQAYAAAEALSAALGRVAESSPRLLAMADDAFAMGDGVNAGAPQLRPSHTRLKTHRWIVPATLAAGFSLAVIGVQLANYAEQVAPAPVAYASTAHEQRTITLADGSTVHLDVASEISVRLSAKRRDIVLVDGRALFEVAHDTSRPFTVSASDSHTTALGTKFQVQRDGQHVVVTLAEGSVAVTGSSGADAWRDRLMPGEQITLAGHAQPPQKRAVDPLIVTSWSRGRLVFHGTPLAEALDEVNRYAARKVRLGDPTLASLPVGGNFLAGDSDRIVAAFAAVLPLRVAEGGSGEIVLFRRYQAEAP